MAATPQRRSFAQDVESDPARALDAISVVLAEARKAKTPARAFALVALAEDLRAIYEEHRPARRFALGWTSSTPIGVVMAYASPRPRERHERHRARSSSSSDSGEDPPPERCAGERRRRRWMGA